MTTKHLQCDDCAPNSMITYQQRRIADLERQLADRQGRVEELHARLTKSEAACGGMRAALEDCLNGLLVYRGVEVLHLVPPDQRVLERARAALAKS